LRDIGVTSGRLNLMHTDYHRYGKSLELSEEEAEYAWRELFRWCKVENDGLSWQPFEDAVSSVLGLEQGTCVFGPCLYFHADAEPVVLSRSEEHTSELQSRENLVCRLLLEKKK